VPFKPAPRLRTFDYLGIQRYSLTICCRARHTTFVDDRTVADASTQLRHTSTTYGFAIIVYCYMPDHLHVLAEGTRPSSDFREFVRLYKQRSSFAFKRRMGQELWQRGYFERLLRSDENTVAVARYILQNPVRASLCQSAAEYPYSGSFTMAVPDLLQSIQMSGRT
jgi:REP element-mobilizing transposase RayT